MRDIPDNQDVMPLPKLLIIEDQLSLLEVLCTAFEDDHEVRPASSGEEGLAIAHEFSPELVITDYAMPGINGLEVAKRLLYNLDNGRVALTDYKRTEAVAEAHADRQPMLDAPPKFILISALLTQQIIAEAKALGISACLAKPFDLNELRGIIRRLTTGTEHP
ncbi:response regulator [candidate division FCPU426 bacterium]|nr:response regulator [candidate division FCPU426 bacterium]